MKNQFRLNFACFYPILLGFLIISCKQEPKNSVKVPGGNEVEINYATGFEITHYPDFSIITVTEAFPDSDKTYRYALAKDKNNVPDSLNADAVIHIPVKNMVVTSTTHIPSLEMLGVENTLKGFPNLDYISSEKTRKLIDAGKIKELGQNESINTETTINLDPDVVVSFGVEGENKALASLTRAGIPVVYNGDWVEHDPLGKAEWIKFFAAFYDKQEMGDSIFSSIVANYSQIKEKVANSKESPTVLSGAMFKDVWYMPKGDSWAAKLIEDAHGDYLYKKTTGTGSLSLSLEEVLDTAQKADFWIAPNSFESYNSLQDASAVYAQFEAFKNHKVFGFGSKKGATGGLIYYELAPNRPDWVLNDLAAILHPSLFPDYKPHFYAPLEP
ncbi:ABC transporter substrate-binding protein [Flavimarina sp. Hel_I_48]|uniref:ABC transporter substrate-binding protein n=1 Tax=Flavimarina sp. Hel_I_48 TaxID=1392488 RepID=UPI00068D71F9|nr:ABC transporter substrate-binding protein [Flavimarina sp. Hel_I_48]